MFGPGFVATALTGYANEMGKQKQYGQAKQALELAVLLRPRHVPAWQSMAVTALALGDCTSAVSWADKVLAFKPDSNDMQEMLSSEEGERRYAEIFGEPEVIGQWKETQELMKATRTPREVGVLRL